MPNEISLASLAKGLGSLWLRSKIGQIERSRHLAPAYVAVVEFSRPTLKVAKR